MKKFFAIVSILFLFSCSNDDDLAQEQKCYMTKFQKVTIQGTGQQFYAHEYIYAGNRIIKKINYKLVQIGNQPQTQYPLYESQIDATTEIQYNSQNQPIKIIEPVTFSNGQYIDYISYDNQGRLSEKNRVFTYFPDNTSSTQNFKYSYNSNNKIVLIAEKSTNSWGDIYGESTKTLTYDTDGNLRVIEQTNTTNPGYKLVTKYDNYDTYKNPYANVNVPFEDIFYLRLSKNNYKKYSKTTYMNGSPTFPYENSEISGYEYNENGYPRFAEYKCN